MNNARGALAAMVVLAASALAGCGSETPTAAEVPTTEETNHAGHGSMESPAPSATASASPADTQAKGKTIRIVVEDGKPSPQVHVEHVSLGEPVTLAVTSDVADEVHMHGYDVHADLVAGQEGALTFTADIPGRFEAELEGTGTLLVELEVK